MSAYNLTPCTPDSVPPLALRVLGDVMFPRYREGETALIATGREPEAGDDVAMKTSAGWILREFVGIADGAVHLTAINKAYVPCAIPLSEVVSLHVVTGRVSIGRYIHEDCVQCRAEAEGRAA